MSQEHGPLTDLMARRVNNDIDEGDTAGFVSLCLQFEYLIKVSTSCLVALICEDVDRHRYTLEHRLVRADGIGEWGDVLTAAVTGPAAQFFSPEGKAILRDFTERVGPGAWQYEVGALLRKSADATGVELEAIGAKSSLRVAFQNFSTFRNKTKGHRAPTGMQCSSAGAPLQSAIALILDNSAALKAPWAYLRKNLSQKYRVVPLHRDISCFEYLKKQQDEKFCDGVYVFLSRPFFVDLVEATVDPVDIYLPNGQFRKDTYEALSYITNDTHRSDGGKWLAPPERLPESETEGKRAFDQIGNLFGNMPAQPKGYVERRTLETALLRELEQIDRHPVVSLTGPGGIGKTSITLATLESLANQDKPPYDIVMWISARDIDLLQDGPKPVAPRVVSKKDIAEAAVEMLGPEVARNKGFSCVEYFEKCLVQGAAGPTLFVLDNFETVEDPADVFAWIDTHIRLPNKVLITTRFREFAGDYPIQIGGMSEAEAFELIRLESERLGIADLISSSYMEELHREADGHPYVIKILLGRAAYEKKAVKPERIVAGSDQILKALFERTFAALSPAAQRTFMLLSSWRVLLPEIAVEAVSIRPGNERFDIIGALDELRRYSLIEQVVSEADEQVFVGVPLAASIFGRKKLEVSQYRVAVEEDRKLLMEFGAGKRADAQKGVAPRARRLAESVASSVGRGRIELESALPVLEYMAAKIPEIYKLISELILECRGMPEGCADSISYLRRYIEDVGVVERQEAWKTIAQLSGRSGDVLGEVHALTEVALSPAADVETIGNIANLINTRIRELKGMSIEDAWTPEIRQLIERVIAAMERKIPDLTGTHCSRLAWLHLNVKNKDRALEIAREGLRKDPNNPFCENLVWKLEK